MRVSLRSVILISAGILVGHQRLDGFRAHRLSLGGGADYPGHHTRLSFTLINDILDLSKVWIKLKAFFGELRD